MFEWIKKIWGKFCNWCAIHIFRRRTEDNNMETSTNINEPLLNNEVQIEVNNENQHVGIFKNFCAKAGAWFNKLINRNNLDRNPEIQRIRAETERSIAETERIKAETERLKAEAARTQAETERMELRLAITNNFDENQTTDNRIMLWRDNYDGDESIEKIREERLRIEEEIWKVNRQSLEKMQEERRQFEKKMWEDNWEFLGKMREETWQREQKMREETWQREQKMREESRQFEKETIQMLTNVVKEVFTRVLKSQNENLKRLRKVTEVIYNENVALKYMIYQNYMANRQNNFHMNINQYQLNTNQIPQLDFLNTERYKQLAITYEPKPVMEQNKNHLLEEI